MLQNILGLMGFAIAIASVVTTTYLQVHASGVKQR